MTQLMGRTMKALALILLVGAGLSGDDPRIVSDLSGANTRYRCVIGRIAKREFLSSALELLRPKEVTLGAFAAYGSLHERVLAGPRGEDHCGYEPWRALIDGYNPAQSGCPAVQEAAKIGSAVIFRGVDHNCRRTSEMLQGSANPLELFVAGRRVEVLDMSFSRPIGKANEHRIAVQLFVRTTEAASQELAKAITAQVKAATGVPYLTVELRSDTWFFDDCTFPAWFPFEAMSNLPSKDQYHRAREFSCSVSGPWPVRCFEATPALHP